MKDHKRTELIRRNENIVQIPMPNLNKMTNAHLEMRASMFEKAFEEAFKEDAEDDKDDGI